MGMGEFTGERHLPRAVPVDLRVVIASVDVIHLVGY